jgi:prepilin-type N-terminal cleavage/methylation domain-containing protein
MKKRHGIKRGFTLIELLVVVTILGLLAIVVLPAFTAGGDKRLLRGAAERLDTHLKHAAARATGKSRGSAVWLDANGGTAVFDLNFARVPTGFSEDGTVALGAPGFASIQPPNTGMIGSVLRFDMIPTEFRITGTNASSTFITFPDGDNQYNAAFPISPLVAVGYVVYEPPSGPQITSRPTVMPDRVCVDLASSTIGVNLFGDYKSSGSPVLLSSFDSVAICFDVYGKPYEIWGWSGSTASRVSLNPGKPIALLCTLGFQSGAPIASYPTSEANPGAGWQNPDAFWVVIDPKTGRNLIVENGFEPGTLAESQAFIVNDLFAQ